VYAAISALSALKEDPEHGLDQLRAAEVALERALSEATSVSEAARVARLYWWTAEYGLVGAPNDYKLYGAGLLSSLWESYACHDPQVSKRVLTADCVSVDYDITRAQPQLFVARDFEHLSEVLEQVDATLAYRKGGHVALAAALESQELCTVSLEGDFEIVGRLDSVVSGTPVSGFWMQPGWQWAHLGQLIAAEPARGFVPLGTLSDGTQAADLRSGAWLRYLQGNRLTLPFASGLRLTGALLGDGNTQNARTRPLQLSELCIQRGDERLFQSTGTTCVFLTDRVLTAAAGSRYPEELTAIEPRESVYAQRPRVPKLRPVSHAAARLERLYRETSSARTNPQSRLIESVRAIHAQLTSDLSGEWLLRWNLLDCLRAARHEGQLTDQLRAELEALELHYERRHPIAMGLAYLEQAAT
jgi:phenylalanine-4-hydroxylase